jgi:chromate reductase
MAGREVARYSQPMKKILAIPGSLRRGSFNRMLLVEAQRLRPANLAIEIYGGLGALPLFSQDLEPPASTLPEAPVEFAAQVAAADGLLIATPEYNHSIPGVLKNGIDWLSRASLGEPLSGKPVAVTGVTAGRWGTRLGQAALRQALLATEAIAMPSPLLFVADGRRQFDDAGRLLDERVVKSLSALLVAFENWIDTVGPKA